MHFWSLETLELRRQHRGTAARRAKAAILLVLRFTWAIHDDLRLVTELLGQVTSCIDGVLPTHRFETSRFLGASLYWIRGMQPSSFADDACCKLEIIRFNSQHYDIYLNHIELPLGIFRHFEKFPRLFEKNWTIGRTDWCQMQLLLSHSIAQDLLSKSLLRGAKSGQSFRPLGLRWKCCHACHGVVMMLVNLHLRCKLPGVHCLMYLLRGVPSLWLSWGLLGFAVQSSMLRSEVIFAYIWKIFVSSFV